MELNADLDSLSSNFFREFSRSEYALKAAGFHNGEGNAQANWAAFALQVEPYIQNPGDASVSEAIKFILHEPPKKQIIRDGLIQWDAAEPNHNSQAENLFVYIRRVRNNLFHGGKFNGHWFAPERSEALITCSLVVLKACINQIVSTREAYNG
ncbi:hypothetical protein [Alcanivorax sp.]|uniref:hypothetical protein n=1 Tax=Alcanivorax sp. TaxID=1872427 RepID=UPI0032D9046D